MERKLVLGCRYDIGTDTQGGSLQKNVLVLSEKIDDADRIEEAYAKSEQIQYQTHMVFKANEAVEHLRSAATDLLVFNLRDFSQKKLQAVLDLRQLGVGFPLLSISDTYEEKAYQFVRKLENSVMLHRPYEDSQLLRISDKITTGQSVVQRQFPRFFTGEKAFLSLYPKGSATECELRDLSKGGACCLAPVGVGLKPGDVVRFRTYLESVGKNHQMFARVSWMELLVDEGRYLLGLQFIPEAQVFKSLLSKA